MSPLGFLGRRRAPEGRRAQLIVRARSLIDPVNARRDQLEEADTYDELIEILTDPPADWSDEELAQTLDAVDNLLEVLSSTHTLRIEGPGGLISETTVDTQGNVIEHWSAEPEPEPSSRWFDGPFSAPPVTGPATPPETLLSAVPLLGAALQRPDPPLPARRDTSWRADEPRSPAGRMSHWPDWEDADTQLVATAWTDPKWDTWVREVIEVWSWAWPDVVGDEARVRFPGLGTALLAAHDSDPRFARKRDAHRAGWIEAALHVGLHELYRTRTTWPDPVARECAVCGRAYAPEVTNPFMRRFGPSRYCQACCLRALNGFDGQWDASQVTKAVATLAGQIGYIPTSDRTGMTRLADIADENRRDAAMAALITTPPAASCADILGIPPGRGRWLSVLHAAGVVTDGRATPRGVMCIAADGHFCRSLGERSIDDWLSARGVEHGTEPSWPEHPEWNRAGLKRADWLLPGGVYVEYAGMLDDTAYAERMASKVALAQATGIELLILTPADIPRLDSVLDRWASGPQTRV